MTEIMPLQPMDKRDIHNESIREGDVVEVQCEYGGRGYACYDEEVAQYTGGDSRVIQMLDGSQHSFNHYCPMEIIGSVYALSGLLRL